MPNIDLQNKSAQIVKKIDQKYNIDRDIQLTISQLLEELGELVQVANLKRLRNREPRKEDLQDEFADVQIQLNALADQFDIDIDEAVLHKIEILKQRHDLN